jgi:CopG family nickel-responsive transcriptional regulator
MSVVRFGVSLESELLDELDNYVVENKFANRSQALRKLINKYLVETKWQCNNRVAGAINLVFDHKKKDITVNISDIQHNYIDEVLSSQHFYLDKDRSLEIIAVKGTANRLTELADRLISIKGVDHGKLTMSRAD